MRRSFWTPALFALLLTSAVSLQALRERGGELPEASGQLLYVQSPETLRRMALSFHSLLADVYWIRAVQHYGDTRLARTGDHNYGLLYPLLDLTTSLDPHFDVAYQFGALFLAEAPPGGPGRADQAIALLEKGLEVQPNEWQLLQAIGFVHYWARQDYSTAADAFRRAARLPGAPSWLEPLAAVTLAEGGNRKGSRLMWQQILQSAADDWFKAEAKRRLQQLDAMDQLDALRGVVSAFQLRQGRVPASWAELAQAGYIRGAIVDPTGAPYRLDAGAVSLDLQSPLLPLPKETNR
jgi:tetratricopeptide (TPR) repeat protein